MRFHANPLTARRGAVRRRARNTARGSTRLVGAGLCVCTLLFVFCVSCCSHLFQSNVYSGPITDAKTFDLLDCQIPCHSHGRHGQYVI